MKTTFFIFLFCLMAYLGYGQSVPTRIYLVKNGAQTLGGVQFYTTLNPNKPIIIKNNNYVLIETDEDSLGIIKETPYSDNDYQAPAAPPKQKPVFVKFERGKSYYFKMGSASYNSHFDVEEMTERAFWLYIALNDLSGNAKKYTLSSSGGLVKNPNRVLIRMATKRIQLAVDTPCQQQWQDMKSVDTGRFCDRCHDWLYNDRNTSTPTIRNRSQLSWLRIRRFWVR
ncbi:hypothetical protein GO730_19225 [Spirosoma sp. HMF3257]|nr:hypothetical protein [Spirosoma telluris]